MYPPHEILPCLEFEEYHTLFEYEPQSQHCSHGCDLIFGLSASLDMHHNFAVNDNWQNT